MQFAPEAVRTIAILGFYGCAIESSALAEPAQTLMVGIASDAFTR
ncbi:MAG TPA: hypothetical protein VFM96_11595 [Gaiellaceae bacterium]|nr:hypothetical protein [Gaiellaceae bacterium]